MHIRQLIKIKKLFHLKFPNVFILRKNAGKSGGLRMLKIKMHGFAFLFIHIADYGSFIN